MTLKHGIQLPFMQDQICSLMLFVWENAQTLDFIETIEVSEVKVRTNS